MRRTECYSGLHVGRLTLIDKYLKPRKDGEVPCWFCRCDCGKYKVISADSLCDKSSCGCYKKELLDKLHESNYKGDRDPEDLPDSNKKSPWLQLYQKFCNMHTRCENPNYSEHKDYHDRGITVCDEWSDYETFKAWALDQGYDRDNHDRNQQTLDRIDVNKGYNPDNCRFVDMYVQANNKTNNRLITIGGETHTISEWSRISGISIANITHRVLEYGWEGKEILKPVVDHREASGTIIHFEFKGKPTTMADLSKEYNISRSTLVYRYNKGLRDDDLVAPSRNGRTYEFMGERLTFKQIADRYGFSTDLIRRRYRQGMREEELVQPRKGKNQFSYLNENLKDMNLTD